MPEGDAAENYKETVFIVPVRTYLKALYANLTASDFEYNGSNDEKNLSCDANAYSWGIEKNPSISITYTYYDEAGMKAVAAVPSREELLSKLLGSLQSPITNLARVLNQIAEKGGAADAAVEAAPAEEAEAPAEA